MEQDNPLDRHPLTVMWRDDERKLAKTDAEVEQLKTEGFVVKDAAYWQALREETEAAKRKLLEEDTE